ncbi:Gfo/Idh/MocA family oxidoreductase [Paenibacillus sp. LHD-38]|uniref:Gfo/Idh/MocA family protein n=1 Tax=Paenibacillus sp. LHD-38 TaxID=3072143 RepID=UPI0028103D7F|nr:Gfo/Idh/MocA family oxidoreductase [Paenibacillus sp. LHD-38]MDQ8738803.1 Gfo/Idh/MocA family oxidoreductase [Paenibacillus sp. LHD-38]
MKRVKVGIIGCGMISGIYLENCVNQFDILDVAAVADLVPELAMKRAAEFGVPKACTVEELLADPEIEIVINLTAPHVHTEVNLQILNSGKHAYTEKPFALSQEDADRVLSLALEKGLRVGSAPDTFLGGGLQTCRKIIDDGWIGIPYAASGSIMMGHAWDGMHPNMGALLRPGWDPLFDIAPYYFTAMVNLLGPVRQVSGFTSNVREQLTITNPRAPRFGETFPVEAFMNTAAVLQFESGVIATMQAAKESFGYAPRLEIYGTEGTLYVPDPNNFDGEIRILQRNGIMKEIPYSHGFSANSRGIGIADMAHAIRSGRPHRASGEMARHVLDVTLGLLDSSSSGRHTTVEAPFKRPAPLPLGLQYNLLDE